MSHPFPPFIEENTYWDPTISPQVLHDSQAPHNGKGQQVGDRAFRCGYKGCGRLYTTAHHLKVRCTAAFSLSIPHQPAVLPARSAWGPCSQVAHCLLEKKMSTHKCPHGVGAVTHKEQEEREGRLPGGESASVEKEAKKRG